MWLRNSEYNWIQEAKIKTALIKFQKSVAGSRLPLWSSGQSSWIQNYRTGFDSWHYQIFWVVVALERGPSLQHGQHKKEDWDNFICVFVSAVKSLSCLCVATVRVHTQTHRLKARIYEVHRWGSMVCIWSFMPFDSAFRKLIGRIHRQTDSMGIAKGYFYLFKIRKVCKGYGSSNLFTIVCLFLYDRWK
jgi:hypothetical protein